MAIEALVFSLLDKCFSTSNSKKNRRRKPWSQLLHCKMTRDSSTPWETLWQRSGRIWRMIAMLDVLIEHNLSIVCYHSAVV